MKIETSIIDLISAGIASKAARCLTYFTDSSQMVGELSIRH